MLAVPIEEPSVTISAPNVKPEFVSLQEAAVLYSVSVDLLRQRIAAGELPAVHAGRRLIRVRLEDLKRVFRPVPSVYTRSRRRVS